MYQRSAKIYDASGKDYTQEAEKLRTLIKEHKRSPGNALLDVAFGTGRHLEHLRQWYDVEGSDYLHASFVDRPDLKVVRMNVSAREGNLFIANFHYLVGTPAGIEYFTERHELGMFTDEEYREALRAARLEVFHDPEGLMGRGLFIGVKGVISASALA